MKKPLEEANSYYEVKQPFDAFVKIGMAEAGYYGSSKVYQAQFVRYRLMPGDKVANLHGGLFLMTPDGAIRDLKLQYAYKHWAEKSYGLPPVQTYEDCQLEQIPAFDFPSGQRFQTAQELVLPQRP